ncbi:MAG: TRAP transporter substrate-binding protein [Acidobacteria bacterium]|nr:TRAP transporter substrate-binding protein [Acidobacteriota bacterium]
MKSILSGLLCLTLLVGPALPVDRTVIKLEFSSFTPSHDKLSVMLEEWCRELDRRSNGRIRASFYPGGILTPAAQTYDSVITGIADIGFGPMGVTPGRFPLTEVIEQPLGIESAVMMTRLSNAFFRAFRPREFDQVKVLFLLTASPGLLHTRRPVRRLEDLSGMKVRCLGGNAAKVLKALGAVPIVIPTGDTYDALRKGIVDGVVAAWDSLETLKWGEVLQYTTVSCYAAVGSPGFAVMNKARWNSLSPDLQEIIDGMSDEYAEKLSRLWDEKDQNTKRKWKAKNHISIFLSPEEEKRWGNAVLPLYEGFVKEKAARGLAAEEALQFCKEWVNRNARLSGSVRTGIKK